MRRALAVFVDRDGAECVQVVANQDAKRGGESGKDMDMRDALRVFEASTNLANLLRHCQGVRAHNPFPAQSSAGAREQSAVIRYHRILSGQDETEPFKINNNYSSRYARKLMDEDQRFSRFFELRDKRLIGYVIADLSKVCFAITWQFRLTMRESRSREIRREASSENRLSPYC